MPAGAITMIGFTTIPPYAPPAPPSPPSSVDIYSFQTGLSTYYMYTEPASWITAQEVCSSYKMSLAAWPSGNQELYNIFDQAWNLYYMPEFWVGVVRRNNDTAYRFVDGGVVPAIDGVDIDSYVQVLDPSCVQSARGCCASMTDRMVGPFQGMLQTERGPKLLVRNCLTIPLAARMELRFLLDFLALTSQPGRPALFQSAVAAKVAAYYRNISDTQVSPYELFQDTATDGATVVRMLVSLPGAVDANSAATYLFTLVNTPSIIFDNAFRAEFLISTPILSTLVQVVEVNKLTPPSLEQLAIDESKDRTQTMALGAGLGVGLGIAVLLGAAAAYVVYSRRKAALRAVHEIH
ncbi:hypothetical protein VOLCADRAFT_88638 [Volvox carteri f. nagariensis]|uniref:C-type lectin domain-containing protein n=1 Tax=Volvox carteri f. nagariensis TaxID=3068 RepID=D8TPJ3_VOLCA|nr:uncharacterized protein VOLCADRAFT_88638 [Volvox carteri f. nagariensis]EFJ50626.1 hypothetical protein VOLCADRAFT_88638 [Volvox carteri f. nagariensis]|eukprot:XP_002948219.1 hypothetical protein VOLCADRAFT_88638 [Volvox carteri f. nagariensis]